MPKLQTIKIVPAEGKDIVQFPTWIKTLSESEQQEFKEATQRQEAIRQQFIDSGKMAIGHGGYIWREQDNDPIQKPNDPVWDSYWQRWLTETDQSVIDSLVEI
jgi:hypothetical protein